MKRKLWEIYEKSLNLIHTYKDYEILELIQSIL